MYTYTRTVSQAKNGEAEAISRLEAEATKTDFLLMVSPLKFGQVQALSKGEKCAHIYVASRTSNRTTHIYILLIYTQLIQTQLLCTPITQTRMGG